MNRRSSPSECSNEKMTDHEIKRKIDQVFEAYDEPRYLLKQEFEVYFLSKEKLTKEEILYLWGRAEDFGYLRTGLDSLTDENKNRLEKIGKLSEWMEELRKDGRFESSTRIVVAYERTTPEEMAEERELEEEIRRENLDEWTRKEERDVGT